MDMGEYPFIEAGFEIPKGLLYPNTKASPKLKDRIDSVAKTNSGGREDGMSDSQDIEVSESQAHEGIGSIPHGMKIAGQVYV